MSPDNFDAMGPDLHACLTTFQLHPATALALPPRPAHIKSAMRLREAPSPAPALPSTPETQQRRWQSPGLRLGETESCEEMNENGVPNHVCAEAAGAAAGAPGAAAGALDGSGAQGELMHRDRTGAACGVTFKNVELGVLFHSSPDRAYHAAPLPDCSCSSC
ncbi:unnamed protein product, partial [Hapterophycus canaliculatus]